ncbi:hypothetical protein PCIT_a2446 [Pseudoalteromonas citrea]|uniref:Uncharacterized protein n=1 Tax=Pseudoalteromonas citrea TaxID=43655 RepID=A0AAD4AJX1_9GAMM|nr:hypothetical protein PCIT_a2446 [Pseudoalteromonas citrea]
MSSGVVLTRFNLFKIKALRLNTTQKTIRLSFKGGQLYQQSTRLDSSIFN